jgi:NADPH-dependent 2,4-dienoyl-CoA reductase/sulfur reductase-like enzyme
LADNRRSGTVTAAMARVRAVGGTADRKTVVVVGAGIAGFFAAERLRERGFDGRIVIVGDEPHKPYNRTPMSKQMLYGHGRLDDLRLVAYRNIGATWRLGVRATGLDPVRQVVHLQGGEDLPYDGLIIATGVGARVLKGAPINSDYVWSLRNLDDGRAVSKRVFAGARRVIVVGTGFIGCEVAASLRARGMDVSLVGRGSYLLGAAVGPMIGRLVTAIHQRAGVKLHLGCNPVAWATSDLRAGEAVRGRRRGPAVRVVLDDGTRLQGDLAVVAVGATPATDWLKDSGLDVSDGVLTGPTCHAIGPAGPVDSIVVAGDVARLPNIRYDWTPRRVEHWITAAEHGQHAADSLLVGSENARYFTPIPRFWTEQHNVRIQSVGRPALADACTVTEGSVRDMKFVASYTREGLIVGAVAFNSGRELIDYADIIGQPLAEVAGAPALPMGEQSRPSAPALPAGAPMGMPPPTPPYPHTLAYPVPAGAQSYR